MRDLDSRACNVMKSIDEKATVYMKGMLIKEDCPEEGKKKEKSKEIQNLFNKAKQYGDDKVQLAIQTYELVDKHIRRLDSDLARFEGEIQDKTLNARGKSEEETVGKSNIVGKKLKGKLFNKIFTEGRKKGKDTKATGKKKRSNSSEDESRSGGGGNGSTVNKNKKQKVIHDKDARKGQKVKIIFHFHHFCY